MDCAWALEEAGRVVLAPPPNAQVPADDLLFF
jgi:hypothetical protein